MNLPDRFWAKVQPNPETGCWEWTANLWDGYGKFWLDGTRLAHRVAYEALVADVPDGLQLDHLCRNRACVNPWHLDPVPRRVNIMRGVGVGAVNAAKDRCKRGHAFTPENTYRYGSSRQCRTCVLARTRGRHAAPNP